MRISLPCLMQNLTLSGTMRMSGRAAEPNGSTNGLGGFSNCIGRFWRVGKGGGEMKGAACGSRFGRVAGIKGTSGHIRSFFELTARRLGGVVQSFDLTSGPLYHEVQSFDLTGGWSGGEVQSFHLTSGPLYREVESFYLTSGSLDREVQSFHLTGGASGRAILAQKRVWRPFWAYFHTVHEDETFTLGGFKPALHTAGPALPMGRFESVFLRLGRTRVCP